MPLRVTAAASDKTQTNDHRKKDRKPCNVHPLHYESNCGAFGLLHR